MRRSGQLNRPRAGLLVALALVLAVALVALLSSRTGRADATATHAQRHAAVTTTGPQLTATTAYSPAHVPLVRVGAPLAVRPVGAGFLGLSLEYYVLTGYAGADPAAPNPAFLQLIRNLSPGQRPVLRIGGDSTDWSWLPTPGVRRVGGFKVEITPRLVATLGGITRALDARLILGLDLEDDSAALAAHEAATLVAGVGAAHVDALELGNEPELYDALGWYAQGGHPVLGRIRPYSLSGYRSDFNRIGAALPRLGLAGPSSGSRRFVPPGALAGFIAGARRLSLVTVHTYPMEACGTHPGLASYPTIAKLLRPVSSVSLVAALAPDIAAAHRAGKPIRVDETQSVSCFGVAGVSDTYAAALWTVETALRYARAGVDGINLPTLPAARYRLWTMQGAAAAVAPQYYGLLDVAQAMPAGARFLATSGAGAGPTVFALRTPTGQTRVIVVNPGGVRSLAVRIPGASGSAVATVLSGPGLAARDGVTLAGQRLATPSSTGQLVGAVRGVAVNPVGGAYVLHLSAHSATTLSVG